MTMPKELLVFESWLAFDMGPEDVIVHGAIDNGKPVITHVFSSVDEYPLGCTADQIKLLRNEFVMRVVAKSDQEKR